jgi:hypothetical protein
VPSLSLSLSLVVLSSFVVVKFLPFRMLGPELAAQFYNAPNNAGLVDRFFPPPLKTISTSLPVFSLSLLCFSFPLCLVGLVGRFAMVVSEPKLVRSLGKEKLQSVYGLHRQGAYLSLSFSVSLSASALCCVHALQSCHFVMR